MLSICCKTYEETVAAMKFYNGKLKVKFKVRKNKSVCVDKTCNGSITYYGDSGFGYVLKEICNHTCTSIRKRAPKSAFKQEYVFDRFKTILKFNPEFAVPDIQQVLGEFVHTCFRSQEYYEVTRKGRLAYLCKYVGPANMDYYCLIPALMDMFHKLDPDNLMDAEYNEIDGIKYYSRMLMVPGVLRRALPYLQSCKTMDAAHMIGLGKNYPIGKMYNYAVKDGNNNVHSAAGHGGNESNTEWLYFMKHWLHHLMDDKSNLITDQMGGILNAICAYQESVNHISKYKNYFYDLETNLLKNWTVCSHHKRGYEDVWG